MKPSKLQLIAFPNNGGIRVEAQRRRRVGTPDGTTGALLKMDATEINTWKVRQTSLTSHLVALRLPLKRAPESRSGAKRIRKPASVTSHLSCSEHYLELTVEELSIFIDGSVGRRDEEKKQSSWTNRIPATRVKRIRTTPLFFILPNSDSSYLRWDKMSCDMSAPPPTNQPSHNIIDSDLQVTRISFP